MDQRSTKGNRGRAAYLKLSRDYPWTLDEWGGWVGWVGGGGAGEYIVYGVSFGVRLTCKTIIKLLFPLLAMLITAVLTSIHPLPLNMISKYFVFCRNFVVIWKSGVEQKWNYCNTMHTCTLIKWCALTFGGLWTILFWAYPRKELSSPLQITWQESTQQARVWSAPS